MRKNAARHEGNFTCEITYNHWILNLLNSFWPDSIFIKFAANY